MVNQVSCLYLQVLKEQEDLCLNIADPFFAEDEYRRLHLAIAEYTFNMTAVAERMYDIASSATSSLASYYEKKKDKLKSINTGEVEEEPDTAAEVVYVLPEAVRRHLKNLGPTVLSLMEDLVKKYELPQEILESVKERVRYVQEALAKGDGAETNNADANEESKEDGENKSTEEGEEDKADKAEGGENLEATGDAQADADDKKGEDENKEEKSKDSGRDFTIFNISRSTLEKEVFAALEHKFALKFGNEGQKKKDAAEGDKEVEEGASAGTDDSDKKPSKLADNDIDHAKTVIRNVEGLRNYVLETTADDPSSLTESEKEEEVEVNFYAASSAFINELQERKSKALMERKNKALRTVNQKIVQLKKEVERVEDRVREELTSAYEQKRKKVENQKKQLDDRHKQIQEAERLLDYYARTGQTEKLAELMESLNIQYEN